MDELDWRILQALQNDFPLSAKPYEIISRKLQIPCEQLWNRVQKLMAKGVIRRIGVSLDSRKLGFCSTLAAVSIEPNLVDKATEIIGQFPEVTHSYLRKDDFNIWFTIIATDEERLVEILKEIRTALSIDTSDILNLPVKRLFKLDARFRVRD
jgi:DNA-binding Lrp family transcriptional regulator